MMRDNKLRSNLLPFHCLFLRKMLKHTIYRAYGACQLSVSFASGLTKPWASLEETLRLLLLMKV